MRCCHSAHGLLFRGSAGVTRGGSAAVCDPNPPRPFARYRITVLEPIRIRITARLHRMTVFESITKCFNRAHTNGGVQQRTLLRRVLRRVLETAFEKVLRRVLRRCLVVGFNGKKGSEKGS